MIRTQGFGSTPWGHHAQLGSGCAGEIPAPKFRTAVAPGPAQSLTFYGVNLDGVSTVTFLRPPGTAIAIPGVNSVTLTGGGSQAYMLVVSVDTSGNVSGDTLLMQFTNSSGCTTLFQLDIL